MTHNTHTHWQMTINNPDDNDMALITAGYEDHIRQLVYTLEEGKEGTPHIQAYIKMKRDCRMSHMKKLFPRGHFSYLDSAEYKLNAQRYAQKTDETTRSAHTISNGDPLHTIEGTIRLICQKMIADYEDEFDLPTARRWAERDMVKLDYTMAKVFVSSTYKTMWKDFGHEMYENIFHTHTHTHADVQEVAVPTIFSHDEGIENGRASVLREQTDHRTRDALSLPGQDSSSPSDSTSQASSQGSCEDSDCEGA